MTTDKVRCPGCGKHFIPTADQKFRKHNDGATGRRCDFSQTHIPKEEACRPVSDSTATTPPAPSVSQRLAGVTGPAEPATCGTESSPPWRDGADAAGSSSPATAPDASPTGASESSPEIPGIDSYATTLNDLATIQLASYRERVNAKFSQPAPHFSQPEEVEQPPLLTPASFSQPAGRRSEAPAVEMNDLGKELTARLKEMFYSYTNRRTSDNRSAQATMGPSEAGTPCDRRLALSLMRQPPVNPGGDNWASFVGTCIHAGLENMFMWADAGTGRFAVEQRVEFDSRFVPKGTTDLIDRTLFMAGDHKAQGRWSRNKLKSSGPSPIYRTQIHLYAYGARRKGEKIDRVAIISWPRDESTLDDMYVWTEEYRPDIAKAALERVGRIGAEVETFAELTTREKALKAAEFNVADDCRFCDFYLPDARDITDGCNGKR